MHNYCTNYHTGTCVTWQCIGYKLPEDDNDSVETCRGVSRSVTPVVHTPARTHTDLV